MAVLERMNSLKPNAETRISVADRHIKVEIFSPDSAEPAPGILYLHDIFGLKDWCREDARELASRGYAVWVPDLFSGDFRSYCVKQIFRELGRNNHDNNPLNQEIHRLLDALKSDSRCNGKLGMIGACLTGGFVLQMAKRPDMVAPVVYHHSFGLQGSGLPKNESTDTITRLQGHWSKKDIFCPARRRNQLIKELGNRVEAHLYDMPHGFRSLSRHHAEAPLAWERTLRFFDDHLFNE